MIRILIPKGLFNQHRIELVERMCQLQSKRYNFPGVLYTAFHEGFLENEDKAMIVGERLSDDFKLQAVKTDDFQTWVIYEPVDYSDIAF